MASTKTNVPEWNMSRLHRRERLGRGPVVKEGTVCKVGLDLDCKMRKVLEKCRRGKAFWGGGRPPSATLQIRCSAL